ncbi:MAG TPA: GAP family protein [Streptosporangiaceae bacterium]|nr:GAP family protein [Streptosporangiaceae bacterium]
MVIQAVGLALLAALSPTAVLVAAVLLGSANPHRMVLIYLAGAIVMTALMAAIVFVLLQSGHLYQPRERDPRYGLRLALGLAMLLVAAYLKRRGPKRPDPAKKDKGIIPRLISRPRAVPVFIVGLLVYTPSLTFIAAIQAVATGKQGLPESVAVLAIIIVVTVAFAWLPLLAYLLAPGGTARLLRGIDQWLRSHGYVLTMGALLLAGIVLSINGVLGLAGLVS